MSDTAHSQAVAQMSSIAALAAALECDFDRLEELREERELSAWTPEVWAQENPSEAEELAELEEQAGEWSGRDDVEEAIQADALSVEVRADWHNPGEQTSTPTEFRVVLCTGGPHVELVGDLDDNCQPSRVRCLYRGWGESGELFDFDHEAALTYLGCLYFGE